jgi:hypothetical protein
VTVDVCVDSVHSLEDLADEGWEVFGKGDAWDLLEGGFQGGKNRGALTDSAGEYGLVVDTALNPGH